MRLKTMFAAFAAGSAALASLSALAYTHTDGEYNWEFYSSWDETEEAEVAWIEGVERVDGKEITGDLTIPAAVRLVTTNELGYVEYDPVSKKKVWVTTRARQVKDRVVPVREVVGLWLGRASSVTFPDSVEYIYGVECETNLVSVVLPSSLLYVFESFNGAENLANVSIGEDAEVSHSFCGSPWLKGQGEFVVRDTTLIAYNGKGGDVVIPEGIRAIGDSAFCTDGNPDCTNLTSVVFPSSLQSIGDDAFRGLDRLTSVDFPEGLKSIGYGAFYGTELTAVELPAGLREIGYGAFAGTPIANVTIPVKVTLVGGCAFEDCTNLVSATILAPLDEIPEYLFFGCEKLASVNIPETVEEIGYNAFFGCTALTAIDIPESVESIDWYAFQDCTNLVTVTGGAGLEDIRGSAFDNTAFVNKHADGALVLGSYMFGWKGDVPEKVVIPEGVVKIGDYMLCYAYNMKELSLPSTLKEIGFAFNYCYSLTNVVGGASVEQLDALRGSSFFFNVTDHNPDVPFSLVTLGHVVIGYKGRFAPGSTLTIPAGVTGIGPYAFDLDYDKSITNLVAVSGGESVKSIDSNTFNDCSGVKSFAIAGPVKSYDVECYHLEFPSLTDLSLPNAELTDRPYVRSTNLVNVTVGFDPKVGEDAPTMYAFDSTGCRRLANVRLLVPGYELYAFKADTGDVQDEKFPADASAFKYGRYATRWTKDGNPDENYNYHGNISLRPQFRRVLVDEGDTEAFDPTVKSTYVGILYDADGNFAGTFSVAASKATKKSDGKATVKLELVGQKAVKLKGTINADGNGQDGLAGLKFGSNAVSGSVVAKDASYAVSGATDASKAKKSEPEGQYWKAIKGMSWNVALQYRGEPSSDMVLGYVCLNVAMGSSGKATVSGTLPNGTKVKVTSQAMIAQDGCCVPFVFSKKDSLGFVLWIDADGKAYDLTGLTNWKNSNKKDGFDQKMSVALYGAPETVSEPVVCMDAAKLPEGLEGTVQTRFLPTDEEFEVSGKRWKFAKNATIKYKKGVLDEEAYLKSVAAGKTNAAQLKLSYKAKTGTFTGSYVIYTLDDTKLKKNKFTAAGVVIRDVGFGSGYLKKVGSMPLTIGYPEYSTDED